LENDELIRLLNTLPAGDWYVTRAQYADARTVLATASDGRTLTVATDVTPEAAAFLIAAKDALPRLLSDITEERAYYARLEAENERLHKLAHDLSGRLLDKEQEIYELSAEATADEFSEEEAEFPEPHTFEPPLVLTLNHVSMASL
jgi:hypothetical protein